MTVASTRPQADPKSARGILLGSVALTLLLYVLPFGSLIGRPLLLLSTLAHEMGHGLTAILLGGKFQRFMIWANGSGIAELEIDGFGAVRQGLTIAGGLVGPAVAAALCFACGRTAVGARACLVGLGALLGLLDLILVRNLFGLLFVGLLAAGALLAAAKASQDAVRWLVVFAGVQLALAVFSRADYLFTPVARTGAGVYPSDVSRLAEALFLPYWFWGLACGGFSVAVLAFGTFVYWGRAPQPREAWLQLGLPHD
jgi:hypothetical protein